MKVAVTGARGMLGSEMIQTLGEDYDIVPFPHKEELDIGNIKAVREFVASVTPEVIVHAAAVRDPDPCETNPDLCWHVNSLGTLSVAMAAREFNCVLCHISSDSVFPYDRNEPYHEFDQPSTPIAVYGQTKLAAEKVVHQHLQRYFILRLPLLFARGAPAKNNLIKLFARVKDGQPTSAAADCFSSVCYCPEVAKVVNEIIKTDYWGVYHVASPGVLSRAGVLRAALVAAGKDPSYVQEVTLGEQGKIARRRYHVALRSLLLEPVFGITVPQWQESMDDCIAELRKAGYVD